MITLSNGHRFSSMAASGALAFDGRGWPWEWPLRWLGLLDPKLFTIVAKTVTMEPRRGNLRWWNPLGCVRFLDGGAVNAVGLTNPGIRWWLSVAAPRAAALEYAMVGSITSDDVDELVAMATMMNDAKLVALEFNASCPNSQSRLMHDADLVVEACRRLKVASKFPLLLKLSVAHEYKKIARATEGIVEAISINTVPWAVAFPMKQSPLAHLGGGGVSGKLAQVWTWKVLKELTVATTTPIIAPSIWEYGDIETVRALGAQAVSFGSVFMRYPWRPTQFVRRTMS